MTTRTGHGCRTKLERAVCAEMERQELPHEHRSLRFRVQEDPGSLARYEPAIVARRGAILFLVEPVASLQSDAIERLTRFLEQHSREIVLVVVTPDAITNEIPRGAYDEIYAASDIEKMTARIRGQDPEGIVRPFVKPPRRGGERPRDTPK